MRFRMRRKRCKLYCTDAFGRWLDKVWEIKGCGILHGPAQLWVSHCRCVRHRDFCKSLLFSTAELSQGQQRFHECLRVAAGYIERWHSASWPALLVQLGTEVACNDLAPSLPSMKTDTLGKQDRCCGCWSPPDPTAAGASGGCTACEELLDAVAVSDADSCKQSQSPCAKPA